MIGRGRLKLGLTYPAYPPPLPATESFSSTFQDEAWKHLKALTRLQARDALACSQLVKYEVRWRKVCPEFVIKYSEMTLPHF